MHISQLSKIAVISLIGLGLAVSPALQAKTPDTDKEMTEKIKTKAKKNKHVAETEKMVKNTKKSKISMPGKMVNINKASKKQLISALNGIGDKKAQAIIDYRNENGAFKSTKDLLKVKGIGKKILEKNNKHIMLTGAAVTANKADTKT